MNCKKCHHTDEVHVPDEKSNLMIKLGECKIPDCTCKQFINPIKKLMKIYYNNSQYTDFF